ncbi:EamA family transporter [Halostagnicola sp. A-GB9-2]|uniref:EamA family transporter n=1 Tax=Halostagnicola sp. A-GB9-2 TaxID=3048066 RepID=UPI0024BF130B|nr:EamA family transporter [Halostagnicola sp. A-GB9-2]MDJ1431620.1 EamA family transporter [Halostagnicola sp. A-GB9-2]
MIPIWFVYALLTAVVYAGIALLAKVVSGTEIDDPITLTIYSCVPFYAVYVVAGLALEPTTISGIAVTDPTPVSAVLTALAFGVVSTVGYGIYYLGLVSGDVSRFVPALAIETIFVLALGFLLLEESFPAGVYGGVLLVVFGALFISYEHGGGSLRGTVGPSTIGVAVAAAAAFAVLNTGIKVLTTEFGTLEILFWISVGGLASVTAIAPFREGARFRPAVDSSDVLSWRLSRGTTLLVVGGLLNAVALLTFVRALETGPVSLATAITKLDVMLVFIGSLSLSKLTPQLLTEQFDPFTLFQKGTASVVILVGCVLIQFGSG